VQTEYHNLLGIPLHSVIPNRIYWIELNPHSYNTLALSLPLCFELFCSSTKKKNFVLSEKKCVLVKAKDVFVLFKLLGWKLVKAREFKCR
jgi:hypothetical protein